jgi:hypothetical protein
VLQTICYLLVRSKCFRPEREGPGGYFTHWICAPLQGTHNNLCERALKKAILHRKNALFYKTLSGARVGDIFMSLIHTAELNGVAPFDNLVALLRHADAVRTHPAEWMPWIYAVTLARYTAGAGPPT